VLDQFETEGRTPSAAASAETATGSSDAATESTDAETADDLFADDADESTGDADGDSDVSAVPGEPDAK